MSFKDKVVIITGEFSLWVFFCLLDQGFHCKFLKGWHNLLKGHNIAFYKVGNFQIQGGQNTIEDFHRIVDFPRGLNARVEAGRKHFE
jgi:hypothetical protein